MRAICYLGGGVDVIFAAVFEFYDMLPSFCRGSTEFYGQDLLDCQCGADQMLLRACQGEFSLSLMRGWYVSAGLGYVVLRVGISLVIGI